MIADNALPKTRPLVGLRILSVEQFGAGPFGTLFLADLGATVIKIEDPAVGGDVARTVPPGAIEGDSLYFESFNRGKRSIALNLKQPSDLARFHDLVRDADAVFNNLRGDLPTALGLDYQSLSPFNPKIVCVSLSAYGRTGERSAEPGYDALIQAETGWAMLTGEPDDPPIRSGLPMVDYAAGLTAALALLAGVLDARTTGRGRDLDTNLYDVALSALAYQATWFLSIGVQTDRQPMSAHPTVVPFQFFQTTDGYIAIACAKEKFFQQLLVVLDLEEVAADKRYADFTSRDRNRDTLVPILEARFLTQPTAIWVELLRGRVPSAPVRSMAAALNLDELRARQMLVAYQHERFGTVQSIGSPIHVEGALEPSRAPRLNEG